MRLYAHVWLVCCSANMPAAVIFLYYRYEPQGKWWKKALGLARPIQVSDSVTSSTPRALFADLKILHAYLLSRA